MKSYIQTLNAGWVEKLNKMPERARVSVERGVIDAIPIFTVRPLSGVDPDYEYALFLYVHGGGFVGGAGEAGLVEPVLIADRLRVRTVAIDYRTALTDPFPIAIDQVLSVYLYFRQTEPKCTIVLGGTSTGGNVAMVVVQKLLQQHRTPPDVAYFGSPVTDVAGGGVSLEANKGFDLVLGDYRQYAPALKLYMGNRTPKDSMISPLFGDFEGFPPSLLVSGTRDVLLSNTASVHAKMRKSGVDATLLVYEGFSHADYLHRPDSDDSRHLYDELNALVKRHSRTPIEDLYDVYLYAYPLLVFEKLYAMQSVRDGAFRRIEGLEALSILPSDAVETRGFWISLKKGPVLLRIPYHLIRDEGTTFCAFDASLRPLNLEFLLDVAGDSAPESSQGVEVLILYRGWKGSLGPLAREKTITVESSRLVFLSKTSAENWDRKAFVVESQQESAAPGSSSRLKDASLLALTTKEFFEEFFNALGRLDLAPDPWIAAKMRKIGMLNVRGSWSWQPDEKTYSHTLAADIEDVWVEDLFKPEKTLACGSIGDLMIDTALRAQIAYASPLQPPCEGECAVIINCDSDGNRINGDKEYRIEIEDGLALSWWTVALSDGSSTTHDRSTRTVQLGPKPGARGLKSGARGLKSGARGLKSGARGLKAPQGYYHVVVRIYRSFKTVGVFGGSEGSYVDSIMEAVRVCCVVAG